MASPNHILQSWYFHNWRITSVQKPSLLRRKRWATTPCQSSQEHCCRWPKGLKNANTCNNSDGSWQRALTEWQGKTMTGLGPIKMNIGLKLTHSVRMYQVSWCEWYCSSSSQLIVCRTAVSGPILDWSPTLISLLIPCNIFQSFSSWDHECFGELISTFFVDNIALPMIMRAKKIDLGQIFKSCWSILLSQIDVQVGCLLEWKKTEMLGCVTMPLGTPRFSNGPTSEGGMFYISLKLWYTNIKQLIKEMEVAPHHTLHCLHCLHC